MGIGAAIGGSALLGAISSKKSGDAQAKAASKSSDAQVQANRENIEFQREIFEQQREDQAPWRQIGEQSLQRLQEGVQSGRFTPGSFDFDFKFEADPGYQFRRQEGINALDASAASRGRLQSGAQARAVSRYGSDLASNEYNNAFNREFNTQLTEFESQANNRNQQFNQLASLAGVGQTANNAVGAARQNMAQSVGQSTQATGNALAQGAINQGNARASSYQNMAQAGQQGMQNYLLYNMLG